jgi:DNA-binding response OmpR family regulator
MRRPSLRSAAQTTSGPLSTRLTPSRSSNRDPVIPCRGNLSPHGAMPANAADTDESLDTGPLRSDSKCRTIRSSSVPVGLTAREHWLLLFFARKAERVYAREQLLNHVWGYRHSGHKHTINTRINRLRAKIKRDPGESPDAANRLEGRLQVQRGVGEESVDRIQRGLRCRGDDRFTLTARRAAPGG